MTTNEFIEMLRKEDPTGNCHIRMSGGIPYYCENKAGYWDGPYTYINDKGQYVLSTEGSKIDLYCIEPEMIVDEVVEKWNPFKESSDRSEEHTSELQSLRHLVCRLLLEKKK